MSKNNFNFSRFMEEFAASLKLEDFEDSADSADSADFAEEDDDQKPEYTLSTRGISYDKKGRPSRRIIPDDIAFVEPRPPYELRLEIGTQDFDAFRRDIKKYEKKNVLSAEFVPLPPGKNGSLTYARLSPAQRSWYFYWRTMFRREQYVQTDLGYIYLYAAEVLNGGGTKDPWEGVNLLIRLWEHYRSAFPQLDSEVTEWCADFAVAENLSCPRPYAEDLHLDPAPLMQGMTAFYNAVLDRFFPKAHCTEALPLYFWELLLPGGFAENTLLLQLPSELRQGMLTRAFDHVRRVMVEKAAGYSAAAMNDAHFKRFFLNCFGLQEQTVRKVIFASLPTMWSLRDYPIIAPNYMGSEHFRTFLREMVDLCEWHCRKLCKIKARKPKLRVIEADVVQKLCDFLSADCKNQVQKIIMPPAAPAAAESEAAAMLQRRILPPLLQQRLLDNNRRYALNMKKGTACRDFMINIKPAADLVSEDAYFTAHSFFYDMHPVRIKDYLLGDIFHQQNSQYPEYLRWVRAVQRGSRPPRDNYLHIYLRQLLFGGFWSKPEIGYEYLLQLWKDYGTAAPGGSQELDFNEMSSLLFDFALLHGLNFKIPDWGLDRAEREPQLSGIITNVVLASLSLHNVSRIPYPVLLSMALCSDWRGPDLMLDFVDADKNVICVLPLIMPDIYVLADAYFRKKKNSSILHYYTIREENGIMHFVYGYEDRDSEESYVPMSLPNFLGNRFLIRLIGELFQAAEANLAAVLGLPVLDPQTEDLSLPLELIDLIKVYFRRVFGSCNERLTNKKARRSQKAKTRTTRRKTARTTGNESAAAAAAPAALPAGQEFTPDSRTLEELRSSSAVVTDMLEVEGAAGAAADERETAEIKAALAELSEAERGLLLQVREQGTVGDLEPWQLKLLDGINRTAMLHLFRPLLDLTDGECTLNADFAPAVTAVTADLKAADFAAALQEAQEAGLEEAPGPGDGTGGLPDGRSVKAFLKSLTADEKQLLQKITAGAGLEALESEFDVMLNVLIDNINQKAEKHLGDLLIDSTQEDPVIYEDYAPLLPQLAG